MALVDCEVESREVPGGMARLWMGPGSDGTGAAKANDDVKRTLQVSSACAPRGFGRD